MLGPTSMTDLFSTLDPTLDLTFERDVDVAPEHLWAGWTNAAHYPLWFCPKPWCVTDAEIDARPGGAFRADMKGPGPDGAELVVCGPSGCVLEALPGRRLVWTNALGPGYRPLRLTGEGNFPFTAIIELTPTPTGTRYRTIARHESVADREAHAAMGFVDGWSRALDQLVAAVKAGVIRA